MIDFTGIEKFRPRGRWRMMSDWLGGQRPYEKYVWPMLILDGYTFAQIHEVVECESLDLPDV